jgi:16S rRNA (uracil1498-N3)-methyltransferase
MHRFYHPQSLNLGEIELTGAEAQHLVRVLRLAAGDQVEVFDGRGQAVSAEVVNVGKRTARLRVLGTPASTPPPLPSIRLLTAAPKSDRLRWLVEKATELGVSRLSLLQTRRSVVHPGEGKLDKLHAAVLAACKQCNRNDLMPIDTPRAWETVVDDVSQLRSPFLIAAPGSPDLGRHAVQLSSAAEVVIAIGPEGDWDPAEVTYAAQQGAIAVGLGPLILRVETAAIAAVSALRLFRGMVSD